MSKGMLKSVDDAEAASSSGTRGWLARLRNWLRPARAQQECDLENLLRASAREGNGASAHVAGHEKSLQMMGQIVAFSELKVEDVAVPRADIVAVEAGASLAELMDIFTDVMHSRIPVHQETLDDIIGMVHIKDLFRLLKERAQPMSRADTVATQADLRVPGEVLAMRVGASPLLRPVLYVPYSMPVPDLLIRMQATRLHMAVVIDEYGGTEGLLTIEDVVEQIVGEISDEHEEEEEELIRPVAGGYIVSARAGVEELERRLGVDLLPAEMDEEVETVGGLLFTRLGRVPAKGEVVRHEETGIEFEVLEADPRRVRRVRVRLPRKNGRGEA